MLSKKTHLIANAGIVLINPFLPLYFERLGVLRDRAFINPDLQARAVRCLSLLTAGEGDAPDAELMLNKLVCGLALHTTIPDVSFSDEERENTSGLLQALIAQWQILSGSSVQGVQETFLRREGTLEALDDRFTLTIKRKGVDVLVDRLPWNFTIIFHPWMKSPIHTSW